MASSSVIGRLRIGVLPLDDRGAICFLIKPIVIYSFEIDETRAALTFSTVGAGVIITEIGNGWDDRHFYRLGLLECVSRAL